MARAHICELLYYRIRPLLAFENRLFCVPYRCLLRRHEEKLENFMDGASRQSGNCGRARTTSACALVGGSLASRYSSCISRALRRSSLKRCCSPHVLVAKQEDDHRPRY